MAKLVKSNLVKDEPNNLILSEDSQDYVVKAIIVHDSRIFEPEENDFFI